MESAKKFSPTQEIGNDRETRAKEYFEAKGWKLLDRNFLCRAGEIDLIFVDAERTIVFMEVKYRSRSDFGFGQEFVEAQKQIKVARAALFYIKQRRLQGQSFRFDIASVTPQFIEHIPNAFSPENYTI